MSDLNPDWHQRVHEARMRRAGHSRHKPPLEPIAEQTPKPKPKPKPVVPSIQILQHRLTWAYHAEAMAKTDDERAAAQFEREHINNLLMEAAR